MPISPPLSATRCTALYVGALLGPSLLLLPGLAAELAGPASILAWAGLLVLSALLAGVFAALGRRMTGGVAEFTAAGLGAPAGRAVRRCFLAGVVSGAPVVCLIGGGYLADLLGGGRATTVGGAAVLLVVVVALTLGGARIGTAVQLGLVAVLVALVVVAVVGSAPAATTANWTPFAPHGWSAIGPAASVLMLSFVGWEAVAPLTARLRDPHRQLPRVIGAAFAITTLVFLALAASIIAVLGDRSGSPVPLADLLRIAIGRGGPLLATVAAVALTLAAVNAYLVGAAGMVATRHARVAGERRLQLGVGVVGVLVLGAVAAGLVDTAELVMIPTALFLTGYLGCTISAARLALGRVRIAAGVAAVVVLAILVTAGWSLLVVAAVAGSAPAARTLRALVRPARRRTRAARTNARGVGSGGHLPSGVSRDASGVRWSRSWRAGAGARQTR